MLSIKPHDIDTNVLEEPLCSFCLPPRHHECLIIATQKPTMSFKLRETKNYKNNNNKKINNNKN